MCRDRSNVDVALGNGRESSGDQLRDFWRGCDHGYHHDIGDAPEFEMVVGTTQRRLTRWESKKISTTLVHRRSRAVSRPGSKAIRIRTVRKSITRRRCEAFAKRETRCSQTLRDNTPAIRCDRARTDHQHPACGSNERASNSFPSV